MLKLLLMAGALGALAISCASTQMSGQEIAAGAGCRSLGDTSQTVATVLSPESVYAADRLQPTRAVSVTGTQPGSVLYVHAAPGTSREYLERVLSCHAAYGRAVGANDPFHPQSGAVKEVEVDSSGAGYAVRVVGDDARTDDEIWHRARDLSYSTVQAEQIASSAPRATPRTSAPSGG
jgi:hypothetical protein